MQRSARRQGERVVRDPIHGDIPLPALAGAIVDSLEFQRLRYIRQNGLLHLVFPGAVHTRFAHSLGTMANAQAVWNRLTADLADSSAWNELAGAIRYLGTIFELSALLHDIGHCAFSHSAERVNVDGGPLFGDIRSLFTNWHAAEMLDTLLSSDPDIGEKRAVHEEIGLILIRRLFAGDRIEEECRRVGVDAATMASDVLALLNEAFAISETFAEHARNLAEGFEERWNPTRS